MTVITFHTTADAFSFEAAAKAESFEGRLGTVPRTISATCGFAWLCPSADVEAAHAFAAEKGLEVEGVFSV